VAIPDDIGGQPNIARVYDALLGGKDNFAADRELAARLCDPQAGGHEGLRGLARANRGFIGRAVRWAAQQGIGQFIDLGCGLPTHPPVHEAARDGYPLASVAYVDNDPVVLAHVRAVQARGDGLAAVDADLEDPAAVLADPALRSVTDLTRPVCVLLAAVLHFIPQDRAQGIVAGYAARLAPGSVVVISAVRYADEELAARMRRLYSAGTLVNHTEAEVAAWLGGLDVVPPGIVTVQGWRGEWGDHPGVPDPRAFVLAGAGRVRREPRGTC
jgi:O-methyltransferase involved in polyketide biosynthesis